jgi:endonuclease-3
LLLSTLASPSMATYCFNIHCRTANLGWPTIAVDTHIFRVSNRTKLAPGKNVDEVEHKLLKVVPDEFKLDVCHWLFLHGRYTYVAREPRCGSCLIEYLCEFKDKPDSNIAD